MGAPYDALVAVLGICGLRWGEAVALRCRHVDGLRRRLIVEESLAKVSGRFIFGTTKSHARRQVPVPTSLVARFPIRGPDELLFLGPKGGALRYRYFYMKHWRPALARLELPAVGLHVLRHRLRPESSPLADLPRPSKRCSVIGAHPFHSLCTVIYSTLISTI